MYTQDQDGISSVISVLLPFVLDREINFEQFNLEF